MKPTPMFREELERTQPTPRASWVDSWPIGLVIYGAGIGALVWFVVFA